MVAPPSQFVIRTAAALLFVVIVVGLLTATVTLINAHVSGAEQRSK